MGIQFTKYHEKKIADELYGWKPPIIIHAGEFLEDALYECGISKADLAERIGLSKKTINDIVHGYSPITYSTAFKLGKVLSFPVEYWMRLQQSYDGSVAQSEEIMRLAEEVKNQVEKFRETYKELNKLGGFVSGLTWVPKNLEKITLELQKFFGVNSLSFVVDNTKEFTFRKYCKDKINLYTLSAWLRIGKIKAQNTTTQPFDGKKLRNLLPKLRRLSNSAPKEYLLEIEDVLAECGIVVVYMPKMTNTHVQGASKWVSRDKALLMLNANKRTEGQFWFNLFHELGHIILHGKKMVFVDFHPNGEKTKIEEQADAFAQRQLMPNFTDTMQFFEKKYARVGLVEAIKSAAKRENISTAIFVGRITNEYKQNRSIYREMSSFSKPDITYTNIH